MVDLILNNVRVQTHESSGMALLDFIRKNRHLTGMKLVCKEGECGACTVLVGEIKDGQLVYQSMTSCITPLANAHGKHIVTIEGLNMETLSPVQQAMVDTNGTQCGFCTPGFVVSLTGSLLTALPRKTNITEEYILECIDGNICRCTGYKSIQRAAQLIHAQISNLPDTNIDTLVENKYIPQYFENIPFRLASIQKQASKKSKEQKTRVGGGTDLYVQRPYQMYGKDIEPLYDNPDLKTIEVKDGKCIFGASMTMGDLYYSEIFNEVLPNSDYIFKLLSSTQIRNMATIGGNLVNASPIGDFTILLLALDSEIILNLDGKRRTIKLKDFYKGYKVLDLDKGKGEFLEKIQFDIPTQNAVFHFEKVSQRKYLDIASVNTGSYIELDDKNTIENIHLSAGGVGPIPMYLHKTCAYLKGKKLNEENIESALEVLDKEISPISDARGTKEYKRLLLRQLFLAHFMNVEETIFNVEKLIGV